MYEHGRLFSSHRRALFAAIHDHVQHPMDTIRCVLTSCFSIKFGQSGAIRSSTVRPCPCRGRSLVHGFSFVFGSRFVHGGEAAAGEHSFSLSLLIVDRGAAGQIPVELVGVFEPHGKPEQIARAGRAFALDRGAMLDQAFDAAERRRALPEVTGTGDRDRGLSPFLIRIENMPPKPPAICRSGDVVAGMLREAGITPPISDRMAVEAAGKQSPRFWPARARGRPASACRASAARHRTSRARCRAAAHLANAATTRSRARWRGAGDDVGMTVEVFGRRVHDEVGAEGGSGRVKIGVATVESTHRIAPTPWAISEDARRCR